MNENKICAACGAAGDDCESDFHQMLYWEAERPDYALEVHHFLVLCYHIQHPHLYSVEGLEYSLGLLRKFVAEGQDPQIVRKAMAESVDSGNRKFKITARPESIGKYARQPQWTMTAADVVAGGLDNYVPNTRKWAQSVYEAVEAAR
jgi:hypothetical protein